ncbi:MAG TPA: type IV toxin-antitoxin system AbiEi family antitoxin domain-containing protein [Solirubrobacterales bacterium]|nr:type IV toxin-antitoxin system AbiEi family antitoxin domain-containing protein [Solirubrobacterales bacterium]
MPDWMQTRGLDLAMSELARRQHGVASWRQLLELGLSRDAISHRSASGRLHRLHRGVYAVGHLALSNEGEWMAAVLAAGEGAVLSHASAAALWGLIRPTSQPPEVTVARSSRSTHGLRRHRSLLGSDEITTKRAIPVTCVARTLFDMAARVQPWRFERMVREAEFLKLPQTPSLAELYQRHPRRRGARRVRSTLEGLSLAQGVSRSALEDRFLRFVRKVGLPLPETNVLLELGERRYQADCLWREQRAIVELDGHQAHGTRAAFESDRERDRRLQVAGWRVVRVTARQLRDPGPLTRDLHHLLTPVDESASSRS